MYECQLLLLTRGCIELGISLSARVCLFLCVFVFAFVSMSACVCVLLHRVISYQIDDL